MITLVALAGCTASGPAYNENIYIDTGNSIIYVYRESGFVGSGSCSDIFIDSKLIGCLRHGGFLKREVPAGNHTVEVRYTKHSKVRLAQSTEAGSAYYVQHVIQLGGVDESENGQYLSVGSSASTVKIFGTGLIPRNKEEALKIISKLRESI